MIGRHLLPAVLLVAAAPLPAQVRPVPGAGDPRLQVVDYKEGEVVLLELAPGYQMMVELGPDEQIENVAVGDSAAFQVTANRRGDRLFVKALQSDVSTNLTVVTSARLYAMELAPLSDPAQPMAYVVRFRLDEALQGDTASSAVQNEGRYRLSGDRSARPSAISDDGARTYIQWPAGGGLPAVYAVGDGGRESLADGSIREGVFVIDKVMPRLVFRAGRKSAAAERVAMEDQH
ncbi:TrbG/VirB9 family P-type conjugative transfer protein [Allosphingosinicella deserti]|uniref:TrbG/VirB9 family P-type conjugative transfer protein n=1 Tax=Allosphingosinicella deserti TaxID=2116704 RepID=UPI0013049EB4|nr:TrbG/VirB9 family P-type conjugative transfer protein [Sphingomonas deserti]